MRIGIDTAPIVQHRNRGVGALGGFLLEALLRAEGSHHYLLFTPGGVEGASFGVASTSNAETISRAGCGGVFSFSWIRDALHLHGQVKLARPDVLHAYFQWNLPLRRMSVPVVGSVYDLMPLAVKDIYLDRYALPVRAKIGMYSRYLSYALGRVDRVIAISEHSRADLVRLMGFPEDRVHVVYPAPAPGMVVPENDNEIHLLRERLDLENDYLLYVGGFDYRKNLEVLLGAYGKARKRGMDLS
ncbi:MAG: glycosyltransferase, partial [Nitrospinaceae bacterium]|nr:glycosyltransferase [Nitrospinaceae bacterium]